MDRQCGKRLSRVKDARGRVVTLLDPYALYLLRRHDTISEEVLGRLAAEIASVSRWSKGVAVGSLERNVAAVLLANYALGVCIVWWWARRNRLRRVCATMLKHLRCPHCGYDLRLLPSDPADGATVCPECGCAWELDDAR